ncbi:MAG: hypothetical protein QF561_03730 [Phycisphaerales bacterium]|nr:hypothetical protein [Phycisphaerales bacterium]
MVISALIGSTPQPQWCEALLRDIASGRLSASSGALLDRIPASAKGGGRHQPLAESLFTAWNEARPVPPVTVDDVQTIFAAKRDAVASIDVTYRASLHRRDDPSVRQPGRVSVWWTRWRQDAQLLERRVASNQGGLAAPGGDASAMRWASDRIRVWFARLDDELREIPGGEAPMLGIEDSWLGAGGCIGRRWDGTARAVEHDLASLLARLPKGAAVVESATTRIRGREVAVLRIGWRTPFWIYMDIERGFAPLRIDRVIDDEHGPMLARTDLSAFEESGRLWLPTHIQLQQYRLASARFGPGDQPPGMPYLDLQLQAGRMLLNTAIDWGTAVARN